MSEVLSLSDVANIFSEHEEDMNNGDQSFNMKCITVKDYFTESINNNHNVISPLIHIDSSKYLSGVCNIPNNFIPNPDKYFSLFYLDNSYKEYKPMLFSKTDILPMYWVDNKMDLDNVMFLSSIDSKEIKYGIYIRVFSPESLVYNINNINYHPVLTYLHELVDGMTLYYPYYIYSLEKKYKYNYIDHDSYIVHIDQLHRNTDYIPGINYDEYLNKLNFGNDIDREYLPRNAPTKLIKAINRNKDIKSLKRELIELTKKTADSRYIYKLYSYFKDISTLN